MAVWQPAVVLPLRAYPCSLAQLPPPKSLHSSAVKRQIHFCMAHTQTIRVVICCCPIWLPNAVAHPWTATPCT
jgi:hypothetical protein